MRLADPQFCDMGSGFLRLFRQGTKIMGFIHLTILIPCTATNETMAMAAPAMKGIR